MSAVDIGWIGNDRAVRHIATSAGVFATVTATEMQNRASDLAGMPNISASMIIQTQLTGTTHNPTYLRMVRRCPSIRMLSIAVCCSKGSRFFGRVPHSYDRKMSAGRANATATRVENSATLDEILERWQLNAVSQRDFNGMNSWLS